MNDYIDDDDMNIRFVEEQDGWFTDTATGNRIDPDGNVFDALGELVQSSSDSYEDEEFPHI